MLIIISYQSFLNGKTAEKTLLEMTNNLYFIPEADGKLNGFVLA